MYCSSSQGRPESPQNIELINSSSPYNYKAWYSIQLGNIPVGVLSVGVNNLSTGFPSDYYAQFVSRVGYSPFLSFMKGNLNKSQENHLELIQKLISKNESGIFQDSETKWLEKNNKLNVLNNTGATLQDLFPIHLPTFDNSNQVTENTNIFYFKTNSEESRALIPFTGTIVSASDMKLKYDNDKFLLSADLPIEENISLSFRRITEEQYHGFLNSPPENLVDFGWLAAIKSPKKEIENLTENLNKCSSQTSTLNKLVTKTIPQSSYLSYRKLINVSRFCTDTNNLLTKNKNKNYFEKLGILSAQVKKLLKEDKLELPAAITNSPDLAIFYNDTVSFLWPEVTTLFIHNSIDEINDNFNLEKNRKSLLGIQVNIASLQPRSVVRADIKLISPTITFSIEPSNSNNSNMNSNSITNINEKNPSSYLINGQYFAKNLDIDLNSFCERNNGKLGIDLGDAQQIIVNTSNIRGIWDTNTRIYIAREFAVKTTSTKNCRQIIFKTPEKIATALKNELNNFQNSVISPDNEILLSNFAQKRLLVMPGKYKLTTTSLVTGAVISTHEFNIEAGTNTIVTAKAN